MNVLQSSSNEYDEFFDALEAIEEMDESQPSFMTDGINSSDTHASCFMISNSDEKEQLAKQESWASAVSIDSDSNDTKLAAPEGSFPPIVSLFDATLYSSGADETNCEVGKLSDMNNSHETQEIPSDSTHQCIVTDKAIYDCHQIECRGKSPAIGVHQSSSPSPHKAESNTSFNTATTSSDGSQKFLNKDFSKQTICQDDTESDSMIVNKTSLQVTCDENTFGRFLHGKSVMGIESACPSNKSFSVEDFTNNASWKPQRDDNVPATPMQPFFEYPGNSSCCKLPTEMNGVSISEQCLTPVNQHTFKLDATVDYCNFFEFTPGDLNSPLETIYLLSPQRTEEMGSKKDQHLDDELRRSQRFSCTSEADPIQPFSLSPPSEFIDNDKHDDTESDNDSSPANSPSMNTFQIVDKDTGKSFDVREVMKDIDEVGVSQAFDTRYSILPPKHAVQSRRRLSIGSSSADLTESCNTENFHVSGRIDSFDDSVITSSPASLEVVDETPGAGSSMNIKKKKTNKLSSFRNAMAKNVGLTNRNKRNRIRAGSGDIMPSNAVHVRSSSRHHKKSASGDLSIGQSCSSSFNPMLLIKTIPKSHEGPAWCAAFSHDGRFLATGGEDGNVCIWSIAPKSNIIHPESVKTKDSTLNTESSEIKVKDVGNDSFLSKETEPNGAVEKSSSTPRKASFAPPLNFVGTGPEVGTHLDIISPAPIQRFKDHKADVIDISWSYTNFLLTASLDSSVRLYHFSKSHCLHLFKHANLVASVAFHPNDDRYFISGGIDKKLRIWSITDGRVKDWAQAPDVITATRFTPDGKFAVAGLIRGQIYFYDTDGLKYYTQIACRNRSGRHKMGRKVTGISFTRGERDDWLPRQNSNMGSESSSNSLTKLSEASSRVVKRISFLRGGDNRTETLRYTERMLVSTNDSRVRLYGLNDFCLIRKYKGHINSSMQIRARISQSGNFIASGSESGHVFIWNTIDKRWIARNNVSMKLHQTKDKAKSSDYFEASRAPLPIVTDTVFFPPRSVREALMCCEDFPFQLGMDRVDDDLSSAAILTLDYDGTMRVFLRKSCIDNILDAATPQGGRLA